MPFASVRLTFFPAAVSLFGIATLHCAQRPVACVVIAMRLNRPGNGTAVGEQPPRSTHTHTHTHTHTRRISKAS